MGNTIRKAEMYSDIPRLMGNRLALDLSENIHLHYRDLRLEYSLKEWKTFVNFILNADKYMQENHGDYDGKDPNYFGQYSIIIPSKSDNWPGRINTEIQGPPFAGIIHIHYNDLRIEVPTEVFQSIQKIINNKEVEV